jgi:hypothetical protein
MISTSRHQVWCASPDWSTGSTTGHGIPQGTCKLGLHRVSPMFRDRPFRKGLRYGGLHGMVVPEEERNRILIEHGYLVPYFRKMFWTRDQFEARAQVRGRI